MVNYHFDTSKYHHDIRALFHLLTTNSQDTMISLSTEVCISILMYHLTSNTVFEYHKKCLIQHYEQKFAKKWSILLVFEKLNVKIQKFK